MLTIYSYLKQKPDHIEYDVSGISLDMLVETLTDIYSHHSPSSIWFGYLDGWMLTPIEETLLRKVIRTFNCHILSRHPHSFSIAWKNELVCIHAEEGI